jgi:hypothetical protein
VLRYSAFLSFVPLTATLSSTELLEGKSGTLVLGSGVTRVDQVGRVYTLAMKSVTNTVALTVSF